MDLFQIFIDVVQGLIVSYCVIGLMNAKEEKKRLSFLVTSVMFITVILLLDFVFLFEGYYSILYSLVVIISCIIFSKNNLNEILIYSIIVNALPSIGNSFAILIMRIFMSITLEEIFSSALYLNICASISVVVMLIVTHMIIKGMKKFKNILSEKTLFFLIIFLVFYICITSVENLLYIHFELQDQLLMIYFILIVLFLMLIYILIKSVEDNIEKMNMILYKNNIHILKERFEEFENASENLKVIKHDVKKVLFVINNYLINDEINKAKKYLTEQLNTVEKEPTLVNSGNASIDCILSSKLLQCKDREITLQYVLDKSCLNYIDEMDLSLLLLNGLENAIENISKTSRKIFLEIKSNNEIIIIKIINKTDVNVLCNNPEMLTSKEDKNEHGYGITSMKIIANKYRGTIHFEQNRDDFICLIVIPKS